VSVVIIDRYYKEIICVIINYFSSSDIRIFTVRNAYCKLLGAGRNGDLNF
jgi:hypothetical protein